MDDLAPFQPALIQENGLRFLVDPVHGQKTGFYIDQRRNRMRLGQYQRRA